MPVDRNLSMARAQGPGGTRTVITFGTFDVFHVGHLAILERAADLGERLVVGVSSDELNVAKKGRPCIYPLSARKAIVQALRFVDEVFTEESLDQKADYIRRHHADMLVMGADWTGRFDHLRDLCEVVYLPRTPSISTTATIEAIQLLPRVVSEHAGNS